MSSTEKLQARVTSHSGTDLVNPREFLQSWNVEALQAVNVKVPQEEPEILNNIAKKMGINDETVKELASVCSVDNLWTGEEPKSRLEMLEMDDEAVPSQASKKLESLRFQMSQRKRRLEDPSYRSGFYHRLKYNVLDDFIMSSVNPDVKMAKEEKEQVPLPNVLLTVQIIKCLRKGDLSRKAREYEAYNVLGSQRLTDLRDKIRCTSDGVIAGDYSAMPDVDPDTLLKSGDLYKSSFFFIENVFYNDFRHTDNKDYSKPIIKWAKEHCGVTNFVPANMEDTTFFDLKIRLGHHYLFYHQGNCEHAVMFTDMRLFTKEDVQNINHYPQLCVAGKQKRVLCQSCSKFTSKWIVQDSPLIPSDPCFLCRLCFKSLLYDKQGRKLSNFKAFHCNDFYNS